MRLGGCGSSRVIGKRDERSEPFVKRFGVCACASVCLSVCVQRAGTGDRLGNAENVFSLERKNLIYENGLMGQFTRRFEGCFLLGGNDTSRSDNLNDALDNETLENKRLSVWQSGQLVEIDTGDTCIKYMNFSHN